MGPPRKEGLLERLGRLCTASGLQEVRRKSALHHACATSGGCRLAPSRPPCSSGETNVPQASPTTPRATTVAHAPRYSHLSHLPGQLHFVFEGSAHLYTPLLRSSWHSHFGVGPTQCVCVPAGLAQGRLVGSVHGRGWPGVREGPFPRPVGEPLRHSRLIIAQTPFVPHSVCTPPPPRGAAPGPWGFASPAPATAAHSAPPCSCQCSCVRFVPSGLHSPTPRCAGSASGA